MATRPLPEPPESLYAPYIEELQEFFLTSGLQCGSPGDIFAISERMETSRPFFEDLSSLIRSIILRQGGSMPHAVLLQILATAVGGAEMERAPQFYRQPLRRLLAFVTGILSRPEDRSPGDPAEVLSFPSLASMTDRAKAEAGHNAAAQNQPPMPASPVSDLPAAKDFAEPARSLPPPPMPELRFEPPGLEPNPPEAATGPEQAPEEVPTAEAFVADAPELPPAAEEARQSASVSPEQNQLEIHAEAGPSEALRQSQLEPRPPTEEIQQVSDVEPQRAPPQHLPPLVRPVAPAAPARMQPSLYSQLAGRLRLAPSLGEAIPAGAAAAVFAVLLVVALHHLASVEHPLDAYPAAQTQPAAQPAAPVSPSRAGPDPGPVATLPARPAPAGPAASTPVKPNAGPSSSAPKTPRTNRHSIYDDGYIAPPTYHSYVTPGRPQQPAPSPTGR